MTLDTPRGPITKFLKKMLEKCGKNGVGEITFSPLWCLIQKLGPNSGLHSKNQKEISKNEVMRPPPTLRMEMWTPLFDRDICLCFKKKRYVF